MKDQMMHILHERIQMNMVSLQLMELIKVKIRRIHTFMYIIDVMLINYLLVNLDQRYENFVFFYQKYIPLFSFFLN